MKLNNCVYCGSDEVEPRFSRESCEFYVCCSDCGARGPASVDRWEAIDKYNEVGI